MVRLQEDIFVDVDFASNTLVSFAQNVTGAVHASPARRLVASSLAAFARHAASGASKVYTIAPLVVASLGDGRWQMIAGYAAAVLAVGAIFGIALCALGSFASPQAPAGIPRIPENSDCEEDEDDMGDKFSNQQPFTSSLSFGFLASNGLSISTRQTRASISSMASQDSVPLVDAVVSAGGHHRKTATLIKGADQELRHKMLRRHTLHASQEDLDVDDYGPRLSMNSMASLQEELEVTSGEARQLVRGASEELKSKMLRRYTVKLEEPDDMDEAEEVSGYSSAPCQSQALQDTVDVVPLTEQEVYALRKQRKKADKQTKPQELFFTSPGAISTTVRDAI